MAVDESPILRAAVTGDIETLEVRFARLKSLVPDQSSLRSPEFQWWAQDAIAAGDDVEQLSTTGCTPL